MSYDEIAAATGSTAANVKANYHFWQALSRAAIPCTASIRQAVRYLPPKRKLPCPSLPRRRL